MRSRAILAKNPHPWSTPRCFDSGICDPLPDATDEQRRDYYSRKSLDDSARILTFLFGWIFAIPLYIGLAVLAVGRCVRRWM